MENPRYRKQYIEAIKKAEENPDIKDKVAELKKEALEAHQKEMNNRMCGTSFESKFYYKLVNAKLIEKV